MTDAIAKQKVSLSLDADLVAEIEKGGPLSPQVNEALRLEVERRRRRAALETLIEQITEKYGELRVSDTGIREITIVGQAIGMALRGLRPIAEIQYLDYLLYALQIMSDDLASLRWRYATKQFDPSRKIPAETWAALEESLVLTPSSFGLQPWKFLVVENPAVRERLSADSWNQPQVTEASHFVVLTTRTDLVMEDIDAWITRLAEVQEKPVESLAQLRGMIAGFAERMSDDDRRAWNTRARRRRHRPTRSAKPPRGSSAGSPKAMCRSRSACSCCSRASPHCSSTPPTKAG